MLIELESESGKILQMNPESKERRTREYFTSQMDRWVLHELPKINAGVDSGHIPLDELISQYTTLHQQARMFIPEADKLYARKLLTLLPFGVLSVERHLKSVNKNASVFSTIPGLENDLIQLSDKAKHPPRDTLYTYCLWNTSNIHSFTGDPQEQLFIDVTTKMTDYLAVANTTLQKGISLFNPDLPMDSTEHLKLSSDRIEATRQQLLRFLAKDANGKNSLDPVFFLNNMRQYWCTLNIGNKEWGPPTPANCVPQMGLDFSIGALMEGYQQHVENRYKYMTEEDSESLRRGMQEPTLLSTVAQLLNLTEVELSQPIDQAKLGELGGKQREYLQTTNTLLKRSSSLTALHWTILSTYLDKPLRKKEDRAIFTSGPVNNTRGASGMEFDEVKEIRDMRRLHPAIKNIADLLK